MPDATVIIVIWLLLTAALSVGWLSADIVLVRRWRTRQRYLVPAAAQGAARRLREHRLLLAMLTLLSATVLAAISLLGAGLVSVL